MSASDDSKYEASDASSRRVTYVGGGLILFILASVFLVGVTMRMLGGMKAAPPRLGDPSWTAGDFPRLETHPEKDGAALRGANAAKLAGYGWTDRSRGRVHIPIRRAMQSLAASGWPDRPEKEEGGS